MTLDLFVSGLGLLCAFGWGTYSTARRNARWVTLAGGLVIGSAWELAWVLG